MKIKTILAILVSLSSTITYAQNYEFKELIQTEIKGAPRLTAPKLLTAGDSIITIGELGYAAPAIYDWDGDGKLDLLVGEFHWGKSNVIVYKNIGTNRKPKYSPDSYYAKDMNGDKLFIFGY